MKLKLTADNPREFSATVDAEEVEGCPLFDDEDMEALYHYTSNDFDGVEQFSECVASDICSGIVAGRFVIGKLPINWEYIKC